MRRLLLLTPFLAPLLMAQAPAGPGPAAPSSDPLGRTQVRIDIQVLALPAGQDEFQPLYSPQLVTLEGNRAVVAVQDRKSYVARFDLTSSLDGSAWLADPVVETIDDGWQIDITPYRDAEGHWGGSLRLEESVVHDLEVVSVRLGSEEVQLEAPDAEVRARYFPLHPSPDGSWTLDLGTGAGGERRMLSVRMSEVRG